MEFATISATVESYLAKHNTDEKNQNKQVAARIRGELFLPSNKEMRKNAEFVTPIIAQLEGLTDGIKNSKYGVIVKMFALK